MNRRGFLSMLVSGVAAAAAVRTFPFRVYSFPTDIEVCTALNDKVLYDRFFVGTPFLSHMRKAARRNHPDKEFDWTPV